MQRLRGYLYSLIIFLLSAPIVFAQPETINTKQVKAYKQLDGLLNKLKEEVENVPFNVNRIATHEISYDSTLFTRSGIQLIKNRIEGVFVEKSGVELVELDDRESNKTLHIVGSDSSLVLRNTSNNSENNSDKLMALGEKYGIDAFLKGHVQYKESLGYIVSLQLFEPSSRSVIWSKSFVSEYIEGEKPYKGKTVLVSTGALNTGTDAYTINGSVYQGDVMLLDYNSDFIIRQSINQDNDGYLGIGAGYHYYSLISIGEQQQNYESISTSAFDFGVLFYKTWAEKSEQKGEYWVELFLGPKMLFMANSENSLSLKQGININVAENIGIALDFNYLLTPNTNLANQDQSKNLELNSIGYGVKILLRL